jgi:hypothetical protein
VVVRNPTKIQFAGLAKTLHSTLDTAFKLIPQATSNISSPVLPSSYAWGCAKVYVRNLGYDELYCQVIPLVKDGLIS